MFGRMFGRIFGLASDHTVTAEGYVRYPSRTADIRADYKYYVEGRQRAIGGRTVERVGSTGAAVGRGSAEDRRWMSRDRKTNATPAIASNTSPTTARIFPEPPRFASMVLPVVSFALGAGPASRAIATIGGAYGGGCGGA